MLFPSKSLIPTIALLATSFLTLSVRSESSPSPATHAAMMERIAHGQGFLAALDQSGGSTPKALSLYGFPKEQYAEGDTSMFDAVHTMRTRIVTNPSFTGEKILGAILFEDTMKRQIPLSGADDGASKPTAEYLWKEKQIVPFLKIDKGLEAEADGVQLMKPNPELESTLTLAKSMGIFGTKMRSVIKQNNPDGIRAVVQQQFDTAKQILNVGLIPIVEPEVDIYSPDKEACEECLKACLLEYLDNALSDTDRVILKVSLPSVENFYQECVEHPKCLRVVALSGGYSREEALKLLLKQGGMIASFSRALTEGLSHGMSDSDFEKRLEASVDEIFAASR